MYIVLVAHDIAPSRGLTKLQQKLENSGHTTTSFFACGKKQTTPIETIREHTKHADMLITGMSSAEDDAREEIAAAHATHKAKIPFGFYADSFGTYARPWFAPLREYAFFLFVLNEDEAREARKLFPKTTQIVATGNPLWEEFTHAIQSRDEIRAQLHLSTKDAMVLIPGSKDLNGNIILFRSVMHAAKKIGNAARLHLFISLHPGDRNNIKHYKALKTQGIAITILPSREHDYRSLLSAADLVIACASTAGIEAAHMGIPVIDFFTKESRERMRKATGQTTWKPSELGASAMVFEDALALAQEMRWLLSEKGARQMRKQQKKVYPSLPRSGDAVLLMAQTLETIIASQHAEKV